MTSRDTSADTGLDNMDYDPKGDYAYRAKLEAEIDALQARIGRLKGQRKIEEAANNAAIKQIDRLKAENERLRVALRDLLLYAERNICDHERTYRGGAIWEICDSCGAKWADDEGGKPEHTAPQELRNAVAILYPLTAAVMKDFSTTTKE